MSWRMVLDSWLTMTFVHDICFESYMQGHLYGLGKSTFKAEMRGGCQEGSRELVSIFLQPFGRRDIDATELIRDSLPM